MLLSGLLACAAGGVLSGGSVPVYNHLGYQQFLLCPGVFFAECCNIVMQSLFNVAVGAH